MDYSRKHLCISHLFSNPAEENDVDDELGKSLYERIPGLEEKSMVARINNARMLGQNTTDIELQLKHFRELKEREK